MKKDPELHLNNWGMTGLVGGLLLLTLGVTALLFPVLGITGALVVGGGAVVIELVWLYLAFKGKQ